jgi:hypothetical protein
MPLELRIQVNQNSVMRSVSRSAKNEGASASCKVILHYEQIQVQQRFRNDLIVSWIIGGATGTGRLNFSERLPSQQNVHFGPLTHTTLSALPIASI